MLRFFSPNLRFSKGFLIGASDSEVVELDWECAYAGPLSARGERVRERRLTRSFCFSGVFSIRSSAGPAVGGDGVRSLEGGSCWLGRFVAAKRSNTRNTGPSQDMSLELVMAKGP